MTVIMTMFGCHIHKQSTLSSICSFSAKRQWTLLIHSCCSHCPSLMSEHLCAPYCIVFLICPARAELEIQYCCSTCCSPRLVVSLKHWKPIVLALSKWVQCGLYLILYVSILVLITVAGLEKRSCPPVVHPEGSECEFRAVQQWFLSWLCVGALIRMAVWW